MLGLMQGFLCGWKDAGPDECFFYDFQDARHDAGFPFFSMMLNGNRRV
jgi:hypothetical protein